MRKFYFMRFGFETGWFWVGMGALVLGLTPYFFRVITDSAYTTFLGLINLLFSVLIIYLLRFSRVVERLESMKVFYYSFVFLAAGGVLMTLEGIGLNVFGLDDVLILVAYFSFIVSLYFLFEDVYIRKTPLKIAASVVFAFLVILLFGGSIEIVFASKVSVVSKFFAIIPPIVDVILLAGLAAVLIMIHTKLFFKTYGFILIAVFFMFLSDVLSIPINASGNIIPFGFADVFTILAYFLAFLFVLRQSVALNGLKPAVKKV